MALVVDASYILAVALAEDGAPGLDAFEARLAQEGAHVPALWRYEVANAVLAAARRGRIAAALPPLILADVAALPIHDDEGRAGAIGATLALATLHGLTVYDAAYLECARHYGATLATLDAALAQAARAEGLDVIGTP